MKIILHIGMPKCGSSSLQAYLSSRHFLKVGELHDVLYIALTSEGELIWGEELVKKASSNYYGYITSCSGSIVSGLSVNKSIQIKQKLLSLGKKYKVLIFSNEEWGLNPSMFMDNTLFADNNFEISIVGYFRPQIEWLNAAWWQWGAWTLAPLSKWIRQNRSKVKWHELATLWSNKKWVQEANFRLSNGDVVNDFNSFIGLKAINHEFNLNRSLPAPLLRVFQNNRHLRPGPHDSRIDFIVRKYLSRELEPTPWVIRFEWVTGLINFYYSENIKLLELLPPQHQQEMKNNPYWWIAGAYSEKHVSPAHIKNLKHVDLEPLLVDVLSGLIRAEKELLSIRDRK